MTSYSIDKEWLETLKGRVDKEQKPQALNLYSLDFYAANQRTGNIDKIENVEADGAAIGIMNIKGVLSYGGSWLSDFFGYSNYQQITSDFKNLLNNKSVKTIILRIQSPGGDSIGVSELSEMIYNARNIKKIIAYADPYAFSAAYWLGTSASKLYGLPSGFVGSVGAYSTHYDYSKMLEKEGIKVTYISAGEKKVDGNETEPLSKEAKKDIQEEVNFFYELFVNDLARNRGVTTDYVKENFGQGARVLNKRGLATNMLDDIIPLSELLQQEFALLQSEQKSRQAYSLAKDLLNKLEF